MLTIAWSKEEIWKWAIYCYWVGFAFLKKWFAYFVVCAFLAFHVRYATERVTKHVAE